MTDVNIAKVKYPKVKRWFFKPKIHKGFHQAYQSVKNEALEIVEKELSKRLYSIYCTGHSLGGALATIMALDLRKKLRIPVVVYTYGSPKVGNRWFARFFNKNIKNSYRLVNEEDPFPQLPGLTYKHVKKYALIDDSHNIVVRPSFVERMEKTIDGILYTLAGQSMKEHASQNYKHLIDKVDRIK
jgi:predicted lipase